MRSRCKSGVTFPFWLFIKFKDFEKKFNYIDQSLNRLLMQLRYDPLKSFISHLISIQIILNLKKKMSFLIDQLTYDLLKTISRLSELD